MTKRTYPESAPIGTSTFGVVNTTLVHPVAANDNDTMRPLGVVLNMVLDCIRAGRIIE